MCSVAAFGYLGSSVHGDHLLEPNEFARFVVDGLHGR